MSFERIGDDETVVRFVLDISPRRLGFVLFSDTGLASAWCRAGPFRRDQAPGRTRTTGPASTTNGDELVVAACDLDCCRDDTGTMFDFDGYRRARPLHPDHGAARSDQVGTTVIGNSTTLVSDPSIDETSNSRSVAGPV
jgi:hypothetical protein